MQKISYIADGETLEFYFNFPYFESDNIVVTVNNTLATSYDVIGTSGGTDPDFPFVSGKVVFSEPPKKFDNITIERHLPLVRPVDFQPLAPITPIMLNQDMNYTMELLKDVRDELDTFQQNYEDIVDKESTELLLEKIDMVNQSIADLSEHLDILDVIPDIQDDIESLQDSIETLTDSLSSCSDSIDLLNTRTSGIIDYVIEAQEPTAGNNYTWYKKYKSGWIEQGGYLSMTDATMTINLPVTMSDTSYTLLIFQEKNGDGQNVPGVVAKTTSSFSINASSTANGGWQVSGNTL